MDETIEPSNFDLIVIGTGLPESIISAAASLIGKTVLQIDPNPFYGTHYSSLPLSDLISFLQSPSQTYENIGSCSRQLLTRPLYSNLEITSHSSEPIDNSRKFIVDLSGPRVLLCADSMVDLILKTGINQYMEFKSLDASFISDSKGNLWNVPDSRSAIFKDPDLKLPEKRQLNEVFKLVERHFVAEGGEGGISKEDLERPFVEFLSRFKLSQKLKSIILHAIVLADCDQDSLKASKDVINTNCGIDRLALYHSSIGRFPNANGAMIYPIYGQGELPQAFCRRAAVKGCIHVLRMPITAVIMDEVDGTYKGVKLASGQELYSTQLVLAPSNMIAPQVAPFVQVENFHEDALKNAQRKVARAICITKNSIKSEVANCLLFFPPRTLCSEQRTSIRVLQLSSSLAVAPPGMFVTYFSTMCDIDAEGKKLLTAAIDALFSRPISTISEHNGTDLLSTHADAKPHLLWSALYIQELTVCQDAFHDSIRYTPMPDEHVHYNDLLNATKKLFEEIYPGDYFFPSTNSSDEQLNDTASEQD